MKLNIIILLMMINMLWYIIDLCNIYALKMDIILHFSKCPVY